MSTTFSKYAACNIYIHGGPTGDLPDTLDCLIGRFGFMVQCIKNEKNIWFDCMSSCCNEPLIF